MPQAQRDVTPGLRPISLRMKTELLPLLIEKSPRKCYVKRCPGAGEGSGAQSKEDNVLSYLSPAVGTKTAAGAAGMTVASGEMAAEPSSEELLSRIVASLDDDKAEEIVTIDLRGRSSVADYMVICSGRSSRQVAAIADKLVERLKDDYRRSSKIEGKEQGDWVLIDTGDVIVHVFRPEVREFYQLEKMWMPTGPRAA